MYVLHELRNNDENSTGKFIIIVGMESSDYSFFLLLFLGFSSLSLSWGHTNDAYNHDNRIPTLPPNGNNWMSKVKDDTFLSQLSIPGSHRSLSSESQVVLDLQFQLASGIRLIDLHLRTDSSSKSLNVFYPPKEDVKVHFAAPLASIKKFLNEHKTETVLLLVRHHSNETHSKFISFLEHDLGKFRGLFWETPKRSANLFIPTMRDVRGKVILFFDVSLPMNKNKGDNDKLTRLGLNYQGYSATTNDNEDVEDLDEFYEKWQSVACQPEYIQIDSSPGTSFYFNYLSGFYKGDRSQRYFIASGHLDKGNGAARKQTGLIDTRTQDNEHFKDLPRDKCMGGMCHVYYEGINILFKEKVHEQQLGIVMMDFPGPGLISKIFQTNIPNISRQNDAHEKKKKRDLKSKKRPRPSSSFTSPAPKKIKTQAPKKKATSPRKYEQCSNKASPRGHVTCNSASDEAIVQHSSGEIITAKNIIKNRNDIRVEHTYILPIPSTTTVRTTIAIPTGSSTTPPSRSRPSSRIKTTTSIARTSTIAPIRKKSSTKVSWCGDCFHGDKYAQIDDAFKVENQKSNLNNIKLKLRNTITKIPPIRGTGNCGDQRYLAKGHLAPDADMQSEHRLMTYYYFNAVPQWQKLNNGLWKKMEMSIRDKTSTSNRRSIMTGAKGILHGFDASTDKDVEMYLLDGEMPIPRYMWKISDDGNDYVGVIAINDIYDPERHLPDLRSIGGFDKCHYHDPAKRTDKKTGKKHEPYCTLQLDDNDKTVQLMLCCEKSFMDKFVNTQFN